MQNSETSKFGFFKMARSGMRKCM